MASLSEITKGIEAAVNSVDSKKAALDAARNAVAKAEKEYQDVVDRIKVLHADYQKFMQDILSMGGTIHR